MHGPAIYQATAAYAGANRQVNEGIQALPCAPTMFAQGRPVDVGVKADRDPQGAADSAGEVGVGPAGFGRGCDITKGGRGGVGINRAKRRDADGCQRPPRATKRLLASTIVASFVVFSPKTRPGTRSDSATF